MHKHLVRHGNSLALVIEKPILELLRASTDTPFEVTTDGHTLILTPVRDRDANGLDGALDSSNTRYGKTLKRLAD